MNITERHQPSKKVGASVMLRLIQYREHQDTTEPSFTVEFFNAFCLVQDMT